MKFLRNTAKLIRSFIGTNVWKKSKHTFEIINRFFSISWQSFVRYLQEQIFDLKQVEDRSSPVYTKVGLDFDK